MTWFHIFKFFVVSFFLLTWHFSWVVCCFFLDHSCPVCIISDNSFSVNLTSSVWHTISCLNHWCSYIYKHTITFCNTGTCIVCHEWWCYQIILFLWCKLGHLLEVVNVFVIYVFIFNVHLWPEMGHQAWHGVCLTLAAILIQ